MCFFIIIVQMKPGFVIINKAFLGSNLSLSLSLSTALQKKKQEDEFVYIYPTPPQWAACDTRSIFKRSKAALNSVFLLDRLLNLSVAIVWISDN